MKSLLKLDNVGKIYQMGRVEVHVLKNINLNIRSGEFIAILGPSGSGKSTLMHIIGALDTPSRGNVYLNNKNIAQMNESSLAELRGQTIGFIFQQFNLIPTLNALQNVMLPMDFLEVPLATAQKRAEKLLKLLGLGDRIDHKPNELSGGERQRVAIARALANNPEILLADEPTGNLDSKTGEYIINFLKKMNKDGKTIILVTHDIQSSRHAERIIYLRDGRIEKDIRNKG